MAQRHFWQRKPTQTLFDPSAWLGSQAEKEASEGKYEKTYRALRRWQSRIGLPGDSVHPKLAEDVRASLAAMGKENCSAHQQTEELEKLRLRLKDSLVPVERAYLLNAKWTLRHTSTLRHGFQVADWRDFIYFARQAAWKMNLGMSYRFENSRLVDGIAGVEVRGSAYQLQSFVRECDGFMGVDIRGAVQREPFMKPIPEYSAATAALSANPVLEIPEKFLHPELP